MRLLSRTWQMLFRGIPEVQSASKPIAAAEMALVRIAYAADLPTPDEAIRALGDAARGNCSGAAASTAAARPVPPPPRGEAPRGAPRAAWAPAATLAAPASLPAAGQPAARNDAANAPARAL